MSHTIAAISTGNVVSAIGIIRMTVDDCIAVADKVFTLNNKKSLSTALDRKLMLGQLKDAQGRVIDQCMAVYSRAPHSYTGGDMVEIACHGSAYIVSEIIRLAILAGARAATAGEFTKRAFLAGKIDLSQAEAVADVRSPPTRAIFKSAC